MTGRQNAWDVLAGSSTRPPRALETRERTQTEYVEPGLLPNPRPRDGWVFRYVRQENRNEPDKKNYQLRFREGWRPVQLEEYPELKAELGLDQDTGLVTVGDLVLCKAPEELMAQRRRHFDRKALVQVQDADDAYLRDSDERMRKFRERQTRDTFGPGFSRS